MAHAELPQVTLDESDIAAMLGAMLRTLGELRTEVGALRVDLGEMRETLERYRPLLDKAEARMNGGPLAKLGRGAPRVGKSG